MIKEIQAEIDLIMKDYNQSNADKKRQLGEKKSLKEQFLQDFEKIKHEIILPAMKEMSDYLETNGQAAVIGDSVNDNIVFLNIIPEAKTCTSYPCISFIGEESIQKISVHTKSFMPNGKGVERYLGEFSFQMMTRTFVEKQIFNLIKESFSFN